jgi:hypothetical protein
MHAKNTEIIGPFSILESSLIDHFLLAIEYVNWYLKSWQHVHGYIREMAVFHVHLHLTKLSSFKFSSVQNSHFLFSTGNCVVISVLFHSS